MNQVQSDCEERVGLWCRLCWQVVLIKMIKCSGRNLGKWLRQAAGLGVGGTRDCGGVLPRGSRAEDPFECQSPVFSPCD